MDTQFPVEEEYKKNPDIKREDVKNLREWLNKQPHLAGDLITDLNLITAYHACELRGEITKQVIDLNYTLRTLFPVYKRRDVDKAIEQVFRTWLLTTLSTPTKKGYKIIYVQLMDDNVKNFNFMETVRAFTMMMDLWQHTEGTVPGVAMVINMDRVTLGHLSRIDLTATQQFFYFLQEAMFIRLREFHFFNAPSFMDKLMMLIKPFMKKELMENMLKIHQRDSGSLYDHLSKAALPKDIGGEEKSSKTLQDEMWNKIKSSENFFQEDAKKLVDESKRLGKQKTITSFFGSIEGTFKKLDID